MGGMTKTTRHGLGPS